MAKKLTKRKAFNFLRSYYDVLNELEKDEDKLHYLLSIIDKQFLNEDPKDLTFIVNLCYESQRHSIENSVKGWLRVNKTDLIGNPMTNPPTNPPTLPPNLPMTNPLQEEEEEKEKEEEKQKIDSNKLLSKFNSILGKKTRVLSAKAKKQLKAALKEDYSKEDIVLAITNASKDQHHIDSNYKYLTLEFITRADKLERFVNMSDFNIKTKIL